MKFNYWFYLLLIAMVGYHAYFLTQITTVNSQLVKIHGTIASMSDFGSRDDKRVRMTVKEYPGVNFLRSFYGTDRIFYNSIATEKVVNDPHPELKHLPDAELQVSFYIFKDQNLTAGTNVPYFYLKSEQANRNSLAYYFNIYLYCKGKINFLNVIIVVLCIALTALAIINDAPNMPNRFTFTPKGKFLVVLLFYNILLVCV
jgi:hypothetical protein